jgi:integrase
MPRRRSAPRLYLDPKRKVWVIRDGTRFIRTGCAESERRQAEIELGAYLGKKYKPEGGPDPLIADVLLAYSQEVLPHTKAKANAAYNVASLAAWWDGQRVSAVSARSCRDYAVGRSPAAARRDLEVLRAAIGFFHRNHGPLSALPTVVLPNKPEPRERWLTRDEARRLRKAAMKWPHLYRFIVIGLLTGSRSGAIRSLQWSWIDFDGRIMRRRAFGEAEDSRKRTPEVRISARLARLLRLWKRQDGGKSKYVVHYNGQPVGSLKRTWAQACKAAKLEDVSPHTLRHTRATWLMQAGVEPWEAAGHLGMSLDMLTRVYGKHHPSFQNRAAEV